jgi:hypothetical protein
MTVRSNEAPSSAPTFFSRRHTLFLYCNLAKVINRLLPIWRNTSLASTFPRGDDDDAPQQSMCLYTWRERGCIWCNWVHSRELGAPCRKNRITLSARGMIDYFCMSNLLCTRFVGSFNVDFLMMRIEWNSRNVFTGLATNNEREHTHMNYALCIWNFNEAAWVSTFNRLTNL